MAPSLSLGIPGLPRFTPESMSKSRVLRMRILSSCIIRIRIPQQRASTPVGLPRSSGSHMRILGVGRRIRQIRQGLGLTQAQFAHRLGVIKVSVARYEAGRVPRLRVLEEIARLGGVTVTSVLQDREEGEAKRAFPSVLTDLRISELVTELVMFLESRALKMCRLPQRYRNQYKERVRELISRMKRDLVEYQEVVECLYQRRGGGRHSRRNLTRRR
jgi:transcriptional regulator with XRE-family HTH domain